MTMYITPIVRPALLEGQQNGQLDPAILADIPGGRLLVPAAASWADMAATAATDGIVLYPSGLIDSYRNLNAQTVLFLQRYTTTYIPRAESRIWNNQRWYLRPGMASAAVPGTSNHGWGLAVDVADVGVGGRLAWLEANAARFGWSWERYDEPWHIRFVAGSYEEGDPFMALSDEDIDRLAKAVGRETAQQIWQYEQAVEGEAEPKPMSVILSWILQQVNRIAGR